MTSSQSKSYSELSRLRTFQERFEYLKLGGFVGRETFGYDRYINQQFYKSPEWRRVRRNVILRDQGCDLGVEGYDIFGRVLIHHINPITLEDLEERSPIAYSMDNLICVSHATHEAIHYSDYDILPQDPVERFPNDTCPWK
jgi:hypothetical protein